MEPRKNEIRRCPFKFKAETHLAACVQPNPIHSNRIHASIVFCADLGFTLGDTQKNWNQFVFFAYHTVYKHILCCCVGDLYTPSMHTKRKHRLKSLDVIRPLLEEWINVYSFQFDAFWKAGL